MYETKSNLPRVVVLAGPTASGKTSVSLRIATSFNAEIVSADSRQVYKEMHIGTARLLESDWEGIPHHLLGHCSIHEPYNAGTYAQEAAKCIQDIHSRGKNVLIVGGTGMYIQALIEGLDEIPEVSAEIRAQIEDQFEREGLECLQSELLKKDIETYYSIDILNPSRVKRALEVCVATGMPYSSFLKMKKPLFPLSALLLRVERPREELYDRINQRVHQMFEEGLLEEVTSLQPYKNLKALHTVGYTECFTYLDNKITLEECISKIQQNTRRYAKRQETWFRNRQNFMPFHIDSYKNHLEVIEKFYSGK